MIVPVPNESSPRILLPFTLNMRRRTLLASPLALVAQPATTPPNILWITCEDLSPLLGCYGDTYAATPHLDRFAKTAARFTRAYATAPVCSPARSCLLTGMYANSLGSMHLRGIVPKPADVPAFPELLRRAGYYTTNNEKEDYNFPAPQGCWDESSSKAHFRNRAPGQPFFAVFNIMATHQGQIRYGAAELARRNAELPKELRHDPALAPVPPYFPDTPDVRTQLAALYTQVTLMDARAGEILAELEADTHAANTVVFFFSDHGTGLPRGKRFLHESGLRVPLLIRAPKLKPGSNSSRLVSFVDFAPTVLSLANLPAPANMQGAAFLGTQQAQPRKLAFASRDRVDEEIEVSRAITDGRYLFIRNYTPHRPVLQHGAYSESAAVWRELRRVPAPNSLLLAPTKPNEELYDLKSDPQNLANLAGEAKLADRKARLHGELRQWILSTRDTGMLPESDMHARAGSKSPRDTAVPYHRILAAAEAKTPIDIAAADPDPAVRHWAAISLLNGKYSAPLAIRLANDPNSNVRIPAAEALARNNQIPLAEPVFEQILQTSDSNLQLAAASALYHANFRTPKIQSALRAALAKQSAPAYQRTYFEWAAAKLLD